MLLPVSRSKEGAGVKILSWKLDNLLRLYPSTIDELEAFEVNNLKRGSQYIFCTDLGQMTHLEL